MSRKLKIKDYFQLGISQIRTSGIMNVAICALYVLMPRNFALLIRYLQRGSAQAQAWGAAAFNLALQNVYDYKSWEEFGGAPQPSRLNSQKYYIWFVPDWLNVWGGGHYTLFRFAHHFSKLSGIKQIIFVYNNQRHKTPDQLQTELDATFEGNRLEVIVDPAQLPAAEAAFATTWQSAYSVRAFPFAKKKFYFMQDYESHFYAHGTASMQANNSYTFGFVGITGGTWLKSIFESYGGKAENYVFATDRNIFFPAEKDGSVRKEVKRIFFYGRPSTERRCFDLGLLSCKLIAEKHPEIEIVIAGLDLKEPPPFKATLLGNLSLKATGELYRTCDLGLAFSGTNLSYLPLELMACGVPVISNRGPQVEWYCQHLNNAYLVDPTPAAVLEAVETLCANQSVRQTLAKNGIEKTSQTTWEAEMDRIHAYVEENLKAEA